MASSSTVAFFGRWNTPTEVRAWTPAAPRTSACAASRNAGSLDIGVRCDAASGGRVAVVHEEAFIRLPSARAVERLRIGVRALDVQRDPGRAERPGIRF